MYYVGFDIGGTKCAASLGFLSGGGFSIEDKCVFSTGGLRPADVLERFSAFADKHVSKGIKGIGISCGGPLDSKRGVIMRPPSLPLWDGIEIVKYFKDKYGVPVRLQNDANACAVAEWKFGAGRGAESMIFLTFGTGLGAGLILGGKLYTGANDNAGEIGHVRLTADGPLGYYKNGSCEGYCSGGGLARLAVITGRSKRFTASYGGYLEKIGGEANISAKNLAEYARAGNAFCKAVYNKSAEMLGRTLSILTDVFNPEKIVIGGVFMRAYDLLYPRAYKVMQKECLPACLEKVKVLPAGLNENIGDIAALSVAAGGF